MNIEQKLKHLSAQDMIFILSAFNSETNITRLYDDAAILRLCGGFKRPWIAPSFLFGKSRENDYQKTKRIAEAIGYYDKETIPRFHPNPSGWQNLFDNIDEVFSKIDEMDYYKDLDPEVISYEHAIVLTYSAYTLQHRRPNTIRQISTNNNKQMISKVIVSLCDHPEQDYQALAHNLGLRCYDSGFRRQQFRWNKDKYPIEENGLDMIVRNILRPRTETSSKRDPQPKQASPKTDTSIDPSILYSQIEESFSYLIELDRQIEELTSQDQIIKEKNMLLNDLIASYRNCDYISYTGTYPLKPIIDMICTYIRSCSKIGQMIDDLQEKDLELSQKLNDLNIIYNQDTILKKPQTSPIFSKVEKYIEQTRPFEATESNTRPIISNLKGTISRLERSLQDYITDIENKKNTYENHKESIEDHIKEVCMLENSEDPNPASSIDKLWEYFDILYDVYLQHSRISSELTRKQEIHSDKLQALHDYNAEIKRSLTQYSGSIYFVGIRTDQQMQALTSAFDGIATITFHSGRENDSKTLAPGHYDHIICNLAGINSHKITEKLASLSHNKPLKIIRNTTNPNIILYKLANNIS